MKVFRFLSSAGLALAVRLILGGVFIVAGGLKILDPGEFAVSVANYRLVPHELINLVAITLPWIEVVAGLFLILGVWIRASAILITGMTAVFIVAILTALARGLDIECGCFGTAGRQAGLITLVQDIVLLAFGLWLVRKYPDQALSRSVTADIGVRSPREGQAT